MITLQCPCGYSRTTLDPEPRGSVREIAQALYATSPAKKGGKAECREMGKWVLLEVDYERRTINPTEPSRQRQSFYKENELGRFTTEELSTSA